MSQTVGVKTDPSWLRLSRFRVGDDDNTLPFTARLARENQWTPEFAERVYQEYLRFIYLAATGERAVTPSDEVDQAWHLHLCYSDSYWRQMCGEILGQKIHHGPTKGGIRERRRFREQYEDTLARYAEVFGEAPPVEIWPSSADRFDRGQRWARVNLSESFVVRKKTLYATLGMGVSGLLLSGCGEYLREKGIKSEEVATVGVVLFVGWYAVRAMFKNRGSGGKGRGGGTGTDSSCDSGCGSGCGD